MGPIYKEPVVTLALSAEKFKNCCVLLRFLYDRRSTNDKRSTKMVSHATNDHFNGRRQPNFFLFVNCTISPIGKKVSKNTFDGN